MRENHYHKELPSQYIFILTCCYKKGCPHPFCKEGCLPQEVRWFPGGPTVNQNLLPVPDPSRPLGDSNCKSCPKTCSGHFLPPEQALESKETPMVHPPSAVLLFFSSLRGSKPTEAMLKRIAEKTLLPVCEVQLWLEHLQTVNEN